MFALQVFIAQSCINWFFIVMEMYSALSEAGKPSLNVICFWRCRKEKVPLMGGPEERSVRVLPLWISIRILAETVCGLSVVNSCLLQCHTVLLGFKETFCLHSQGLSRWRILLEKEGCTFLWNISDRSSIEAASYPNRLESSITLLWTTRNALSLVLKMEALFSVHSLEHYYFWDMFVSHIDCHESLSSLVGPVHLLSDWRQQILVKCLCVRVCTNLCGITSHNTQSS
jgi:hypothetical protein